MSKHECFLFIETNEIGGLEGGKFLMRGNLVD